MYEDGARFQKHVDNTARDGRRLTVLVYLNEGWGYEQDGGALRVFPAAGGSAWDDEKGTGGKDGAGEGAGAGAVADRDVHRERQSQARCAPKTVP